MQSFEVLIGSLIINKKPLLNFIPSCLMKLVLTILLLSSSLMGLAQNKVLDFNYIDQKVKTIRITKKDSLAQALASLGSTELEKVRAIFRWITEHIDYNMKVFKRNKVSITGNLVFEDSIDNSRPLQSLNERVAEKVLRRKTAFCDGYSRLFKTLCDYAGIRSEIILGYARGDNENPGERFAVNHTWNAVFIDGTWRLLDVTWASGYVTYTSLYVKQYNDFYFLTSPELFIKEHYPEDLYWTLLTNPPVLQEFKQSPFQYSAFIKTGILSYTPANGIIEANTGDSIKIELRVKPANGSLFIAESPTADSPLMILNTSVIYPADKISLAHVISDKAGDWLYIFHNDEIVMRYKLNRKKEKDLTIIN